MFFSFVFCWLRRFWWVEGLDTLFYGEIRGKNFGGGLVVGGCPVAGVQEPHCGVMSTVRAFSVVAPPQFLHEPVTPTTNRGAAGTFTFTDIFFTTDTPGLIS